MTFSVPSYVIPGTYLENLWFLADKPWVESVELLFFIYDDETRRLLDAEIERIRGFADRFRFTAHLPDTTTAEHEELIERTAGFVTTYVVHPHPGLVDFLPDWRSRYGERFFLENTRWMPVFERTLRRLEAARPGQGVCCDVGHLVLQGLDPASFLARYGDRIGEVHLHGLANGMDHHALTGSEPWLSAIAPFLEGFGGVLEEEVFSWEEANRTHDAVLSVLGNGADTETTARAAGPAGTIH